MKKLCDLNNEDFLMIEEKGNDPVVMSKEEFLQSSYYTDKENVKVSIGEAVYARFSLIPALEMLQDDMFEDWLDFVIEAIPEEVRERIEDEVNGYLIKYPSYYPGEEIDWLT